MCSTSESYRRYEELLHGRKQLRKDEVFELLGRVQDASGEICSAVVADLSLRSGVPVARLFGAVTAYPGFKLTEE